MQKNKEAMGVRKKRNSKRCEKEANKSITFIKLNNYPTSPRKMRLADLVKEVRR
jgi:hypothetical protein